MHARLGALVNERRLEPVDDEAVPGDVVVQLPVDRRHERDGSLHEQFGRPPADQIRIAALCRRVALPVEAPARIGALNV